jgi:hypothetical protein
MFIGHFALGFAAKKLLSKPSLGTYFLAAQLLDLLWPTFLLLNIEQAEISHDPANPIPLSFTSYPISHSLLTVVGWGALFGFLYFAIMRNYKASILLAAAVISHWFLDLVVHIPDLPLYPGNAALVGLGLWRSKIASLFIELALFALAAGLYLRSTKAKNKTGVYATGSLIIFLIIVHLMNVFGAAPPNIQVVAWAGQLQWLFVLVAYWSDSNRISKTKNAHFSLANYNKPMVKLG